MEPSTQNGLDSMDVALASRLCAMASEANPGWVSGADTFLAVALASRAMHRGFVCLDLLALGSGALLDQDEVRLPDPETLVKALGPLCRRSDEGRNTPLVLDLSSGRPKLYLDRYWRYECIVFEEVKARIASGAADFAAEALARLLPGNEPLHNAAMTCASRRFSLLSTGDWTARVLAGTILALLPRHPDLRIRILASTGRAAAQMRKDLIEALVPVWSDREAMPVATGTFHDGPTGGQFFEDDVVVVGDASALDIRAMARLLERVPRRARLVLVGDRNHLASPVCGTVFRDLFDALSGSGAAVELPRVDESPKASLLGAIMRSDIGSVLGLLGGGGVTFVPMGPNDSLGSLMPIVVEAYGNVFKTAVEEMRAGGDLGDAAPALEALGRFRILCVESLGPRGAMTMNRVVQQWVSPARRLCPIVLQGNAIMDDLCSGDLGVLVRDPHDRDRSRAYFQGPDGVKEVLEARLPAYESAFALTVHRGQGLGADHVLLVLPEGPCPALNREAICIALAQARQHVTLAGSRDVLCEGISRQAGRATGLVDRFEAR